MKKLLRRSLVMGLAAATVACASSACTPSGTASTQASSAGGQSSTAAQASSAASSAKKTYSGTLKVQLIGGFSMQDSTDGTTGKKVEGMHVIQSDFESKYPGAKLEFVIMGWDDYVKKTQTMIMANEADIYEVPGIALMADMDVLEPLQPMMDADKSFDKSVYLDGQIDGWKIQGPNDKELSVYALPMYSDTRVIGYDKTIFDAFGVPYLSEKPTIQEILEKAKKLTGTNPKTGVANYGVCWRGSDSGDLLVNIAEGLGGSWGEGNRFNQLKYNFSSKEFVEAANDMVELQKYAPQGVISNAGGEKWGMEGNDVAIYLRSGLFVKNAKTLGVDKNYGVCYPFLNQKTGTGSMFAGGPFAIGKTSTQKELAWEFLKYVSTDSWQKFMWDNYGMMPCTKSVYNYDGIKGDDQYKICFNAVGTEWTPRYPYRAAAPKGYLSAAVESICNGTTSPETALAKAQSESEKWSSQQ